MACAICNHFEGTRKCQSRSTSEAITKRRHHFVDDLAWHQLLQSAESCYRCEILVRGCRGCFQQHGIDESDIARCNLRFYYPTWQETALEDPSNKFLIFHLRSGRKFEIEWLASEEDDSPFPEEWSDWINSGRVASPRTDSDEAFVAVDKFISECVIDHALSDEFTCKPRQATPLPTRILDLGAEKTPTLRLWETDGEFGDYLCLSHCWGVSQIITTTRANIDSHKQQIPHEALPQTFRDAISVTRRLGFRYIWIDSLCIVQDDAHDWQVESAKMASVYSNGYLTIAATHSDSGSGGLFAPTPHFEVSGTTPSGQPYLLIFRQRIDHHSEMIKIDMEFGFPTVKYHPLLTRAWVFQERMLSPRVLHFGHYEIWFECNGMMDCECGDISVHDGIPDAVTVLMKSEYSSTLDVFNSELWVAQRPEEIRYKIGCLWRTMVSDYSSLGLTKQADKLPAIGGLARTFFAKRGCAYIAGLWEESLQDDLIWTVTARAKVPRAYPLSAPTWSWASVSIHVLYFDEILYTEGEMDLSDLGPPREHLTTIEDFRVAPAGADEFGAVRRGSVTITGLLRPGILHKEAEGDGSNEARARHFICFPNMRVPMDADYMLDAPGPAHCEMGTRVFCLRMSRIDVTGGQYLVSLVLRQSPEESQHFERIGSVLLIARPPPVDLVGEIYQEAEIATVTIL